MWLTSPMATNNDQRTWLSNEDLAKRYDLSVDTVRKWRHEGTGPVGLRFGRHVRYSFAEVERWEQEQAAKQAQPA